MEHAARPPARFSSLPNQEIVNTNKSHEVTPFWHNDTHPRVTVTFGARRTVRTVKEPQVGIEAAWLLRFSYSSREGIFTRARLA